MVGIHFSLFYVAELGVLDGYVPYHEYDASKDFFEGFEVLDVGHVEEGVVEYLLKGEVIISLILSVNSGSLYK